MHGELFVEIAAEASFAAMSVLTKTPETAVVVVLESGVDQGADAPAQDVLEGRVRKEQVEIRLDPRAAALVQELDLEMTRTTK